MRAPTAYRFWKNVVVTDSCWMWTAAVSPKGYGIFHSDKKVPAHRYSYELYNGAIPSGLLVLHRCDNPPCVRPDHLFLGTNADNMADRNAKNRQSRGAKNCSSASLCEDRVRQIRKEAARGVRHRDIALRFGVDTSQISRIANRKTWKWVD